MTTWTDIENYDPNFSSEIHIGSPNMFLNLFLLNLKLLYKFLHQQRFEIQMYIYNLSQITVGMLFTFQITKIYSKI